MEEVLKQLRREGFPVQESDEANLSPLINDHISMLGKYPFAIPGLVAQGHLRPLRNPSKDREDRLD
jgi:hypothetical protein